MTDLVSLCQVDNYIAPAVNTSCSCRHNKLHVVVKSQPKEVQN
jgi:hypothetical protein